MTLIKKPLEEIPLPQSSKPPNKINIYKVIIGALIISAIIMGTIISIKQCNNSEKDKIGLVNAINDTLVHTGNGKWIRAIGVDTIVSKASISAIQMENVANFLKLNLRDSENRQLQATVLFYKSKLKAGSSVTNSRITTSIETKIPTVIKPTQYEIDLGKDIGTTGTISLDSSACFPIYYNQIINKWIDYKAFTNKDSSIIALKVFNDFTTVVGYDKGKPYVEMTTDNPYSAVKILRTFQVSMPKPKRFGLGFSTGVTLGKNFTAKYSLSLGLNYNIIRF